jgi:hypothetical protein
VNIFDNNTITFALRGIKDIVEDTPLELVGVSNSIVSKNKVIKSELFYDQPKKVPIAETLFFKCLTIGTNLFFPLFKLIIIPL